MCVSVVVPTFKRPTLLARCLEALLAQDFAPIEYEVIIVDDAVSDQTRCQVEQYAKRAEMEGHTIRYFAATNSHGPAAARNIGLYAAYGEIIAFTDDDCIPSPGWLKAGVMEDGVITPTEAGTPQGAVATPWTQKITFVESVSR